MKKIAYLLITACITAGFTGMVMAAPKKAAKAAPAKAEEKAKAETKKSDSKTGFQPFAVYIDQGAKGNHFAPSGWMGDYGDIKVNPGSAENPRSGKTAVKITYSGKMTQGAGWAGVFWQQPANNWGDKKGGYNLTGATKLTFWARGEKGGEKIAEFKVGGITGEYPDSDSESIGPIELTKDWQKFTIDLKGKDLSNIIGGFAWAASKDDNPDGMVFYLDDIVYE